MSANLDAIVWYLRPIAEHLVNGLILSGVIFLGSLLAFRLLFREQRWSASTRHRASLLLFLVLAGTPILTAFRPTPTSDVPRIEQRFPEQTCCLFVSTSACDQPASTSSSQCAASDGFDQSRVTPENNYCRIIPNFVSRGGWPVVAQGAATVEFRFHCGRSGKRFAS